MRRLMYSSGTTGKPKGTVHKVTEATDKSHDEPHVKNVQLVEDTASRAGAAGFDMQYAWVPAIAVLIALGLVSFFF